MIVLETPRLQFKTWELGDFEAFAAIARDPRVMRYIAEGTPWSDARIGWFMGRQSVLQETLGYCNWLLLERRTASRIGFCGLAPLTSVGEVEIGWWLAPSHWHQGFGIEAARCTLQAGFERHSLSSIVARAYRANTRSIALMEKLGMRFDRLLGHGPMGGIDLYRIAR